MVTVGSVQVLGPVAADQVILPVIPLEADGREENGGSACLGLDPVTWDRGSDPLPDAFVQQFLELGPGGRRPGTVLLVSGIIGGIEGGLLVGRVVFGQAALLAPLVVVPGISRLRCDFTPGVVVARLIFLAGADTLLLTIRQAAASSTSNVVDVNNPNDTPTDQPAYSR